MDTNYKKKTNVNDASTVWDNKIHLSTCSIVTFFGFWLLITLEGYYAMLDCEIMNITFRYWARDENCNSGDATSIFSDDLYIYNSTVNGENIVTLSENGITQGEVWFSFGIIGCISCLFLLIYWFVQIYTTQTESFIKFNYWFSHCVSCPVLTILALATQLTGYFLYKGFYIVYIFTDYNEDDFTDAGCDAYNDFDDVITDPFFTITYFTYIGGVGFYAALIPCVMTIAFCARGSIVFKKYEDYHCQLCCRCCKSCCKCQCENQFCRTICCLKSFQLRQDFKLEQYAE